MFGWFRTPLPQSPVAKKLLDMMSNVEDWDSEQDDKITHKETGLVIYVAPSMRWVQTFSWCSFIGDWRFTHAVSVNGNGLVIDRDSTDRWLIADRAITVAKHIAYAKWKNNYDRIEAQAEQLKRKLLETE